MTDTITQIEGAVSALQSVTPAITGVVDMLVPGAAPVMTLTVPILSIVNEILAAIETLKTGGMAHESAVAVIGQTVSQIGASLTNAAPAAAATVTAASSK